MKYDVEEISPGRFLVRDTRATGILKTEGEIDGNRFRLTSWRREGLLARLRERGFRVHTLEDSISSLPHPPGAPPVGHAAWRPLGHPAERYSGFDARLLRWWPIETEERGGTPGVVLYPGWPVRRRRGRGPADYFLPPEDRGGLRPITEDQALLIGYAHAAAEGALLRAQPSQGGRTIPDVELPSRYREVLHSMAARVPEGLLLDAAAWPFAQELFARLGVRLAT